MSDMERLVALFESFGLVPKTDIIEAVYGTRGNIPVAVGQQTVTLDEDDGIVEGYLGFYTLFRFDADGKFLTVGAWE